LFVYEEEYMNIYVAAEVKIPRSATLRALEESSEGKSQLTTLDELEKAWIEGT
jgi:hypothetical protein